MVFALISRSFFNASVKRGGHYFCTESYKEFQGRQGICREPVQHGTFKLADVYIYIYRYTVPCVPSEAVDCTVVFQHALRCGSYCSSAIRRLVLLLEQRGSVGTQAAALCECRTHKYQREGENKRVSERARVRERERARERGCGEFYIGEQNIKTGMSQDHFPPKKTLLHLS